jgi:nucleoid-associated protein YgaU
MPTYPPISVRQPRPFDIVDDPVVIAGVGTGFEGQFSARVRDGNGTELGLTSVTAGGMGLWGNYNVSIPLGGPPSTHIGTVEVFEFSPKGDGTELNKVTVPVSFGPSLINPYHGFEQYTVAPGDTLSHIAQVKYGNAALFTRIFDANRDEIANPNLIFPGQVLRIPQ